MVPEQRDERRIRRLRADAGRRREAAATAEAVAYRALLAEIDSRRQRVTR